MTQNGTIVIPEATEDRPVRHVLVIGGAGYVGSVTVGALMERGFDVTVMDALMYGDDSIRHYLGRPGFSVVRGDLRSVEDIVRASKGADAIVHLGALVGDPACAHDESLARAVNLDATRTVAAVARGLGIERLIFASSCGVYGASDGLLDESSPLDPVSVYSRTKQESEDVLLSQPSGGFAPTILRFGTFFGPSPRPRFDLVVNALVARAVRDGEISIFGGDQWRPFLHVADGADAIVSCLEAPTAVVGNRVYNVGSDAENHTLAELGRLVVEAVPGSTLTIAPPASVEANYRVSFRRIREELGFLAPRTLAQGICEIRDELALGQLGDHDDPRYSNIKSLELADSAPALQAAGGAA